MEQLTVTIVQGTAEPYPPAEINIVIDVIRAFTVDQVAFLRGVREILLVNTVEEAFALRDRHPAYLLAGEIAGLPIAGFDLDNSPHTFSQADIADKTVVQKTSNGVKATLLALNANTILVTGLSNAKKTAQYAARLAAGIPGCRVNLIASRAGDDDDLACAHYIEDQLLGVHRLALADIQTRIRASRPAQKFLDPDMPEFNQQDLAFCCQEVPCDFVMRVDTTAPLPRIVKAY